VLLVNLVLPKFSKIFAPKRFLPYPLLFFSSYLVKSCFIPHRNIQRIVFSSLKKFDGKSFGELPSYHAKQIAGRAGRYRSKYETGYVNA